MKSLILLGRSPFISTLDVPRLIANNFTIGFNYCPYAVDVLFSLFLPVRDPVRDTVAKLVIHERSYAPDICSVYNYELVSLVPANKLEEFKPGALAFCIFSPSAALHWAILQGFEKVYLVGIDHVETDREFVHADGIDDDLGKNMLPSAHSRFKQFVYECAKFIDIYQCNPAVAPGWKLPYCDVKDIAQ